MKRIDVLKALEASFDADGKPLVAAFLRALILIEDSAKVLVGIKPDVPPPVMPPNT